ncbi:MAG: pyridoxamine 5'-phosphate oxidase family protein [Anaerolineae bacterium]|nr:pyridoxamine 5'-phosphate oxidase family protein [Anaerolineae bacterium]
MRVESFAEIEADFHSRVARDLCCNLATIDSRGRPRSRVVHPLWEGPKCWVLTDRSTPKAGHIVQHPFVSLAYIGDSTKPAYAECRAEWVEDFAEKQRVWDAFVRSPVGYDPALFYERVSHPDLGLLKLTPWRIQIDDTDGETLIWEQS